MSQKGITLDRTRVLVRLKKSLAEVVGLRRGQASFARKQAARDETANRLLVARYVEHLQMSSPGLVHHQKLRALYKVVDADGAMRITLCDVAKMLGVEEPPVLKTYNAKVELRKLKSRERVLRARIELMEDAKDFAKPMRMSAPDYRRFVRGEMM